MGNLETHDVWAQTLRSVTVVFLSQNLAHAILEVTSEGEDPMSLVGCEFGLKFFFTLKTVILLLDFPSKELVLNLTDGAM